jgi:HSP20 family protein
MTTQQVQTEQTSEPTAPAPQAAIQSNDSTTAPVRREPLGTPFAGPFSLMRRMSEDIGRLFEDFFGTGRLSTERPGPLPEGWWPAIDVFQRDGKLFVKADVPGLNKDDIKVELRDDQLTISGERKSESERSEQGYYRCERSCGSFSRTIALPEGAKPDTAAASFDNGVLEVTVEVSPRVERQARVIEVREGQGH